MGTPPVQYVPTLGPPSTTDTLHPQQGFGNRVFLGTAVFSKPSEGVAAKRVFYHRVVLHSIG